MINATEICNAANTNSQLDFVNALTWNVYGITLAIIFLVPLIFLIIISAANGSIGTKRWLQDFLTYVIIQLILIILTFAGFIQIFTAI